MVAKKNQWVVGAAVLLVIVVGALFLSSGAKLPFSITYNFEANKVYEPAIGTLTCREGQNAPTQVTNFVPTQTGTDGTFETQLGAPALYSNGRITLDQFSSYQTYVDFKHPKNYFSENQCFQSHCDLITTDPNQWIQCPSGYAPLWKWTVNGNVAGYNVAIKSNDQYNPVFSFQTVSPIGNHVIPQNALTRLSFACVKQVREGLTVTDHVGTVQPSGLSYSVQVFYKQFEINTPGDVPAYVPSTEGCTWNALYNSLNGNQLSPTQNNSLSGILNVLTGNNSVSQGQIELLVPPASGFNRSTTIEPYGLNQQHTFVAGWRQIPGVNVLTLDTGDKVVISQANRVVYKVNSIPLSNGAQAFVANQVFKQNPQCINDFECQQAQGASWACKKTGTNVSELFTCFNTQPNGGNTCTPATQIVDCGAPFYRQNGSSTQYVVPTCSNGSCVQNPQTVSCNPSAAPGQNGCPTSQPICSTNPNGTTSCTTQAVPKTTCPGDCCRESNVYYSKECPTGKTCQDNGGLVGVCISPPPLCGNGVIDSGENCQNCSGDLVAVNGPEACPSVIPPVTQCGFLQTKVTIHTPQYFLWVIPVGESVSTACQLDWPVFSIIVLFLLAVVAIGFAYPYLKKGKKGR